MKITYYVHDLSFPLREGIRKQAFWLAKEMQNLGHEVEIISTSKNSRTLIIDGIKITYGSPLKISKCRADVLHYLSHPSPLIITLLLRAKAKKQIMTMFDGNLNGFWQRPWSFYLNHLVNKKINLITLQTEHQKLLLQKTKIKAPIKLIPPLIPNFSRSAKKSSYPTLLFMAHLHPNKGIFEVLKAYNMLKTKMSNLKLIIADSGITKHKSVYNKIKRLNDKNIILKETVNPEEELSKAWVYLYPITSSQETFSIPLSLIESIQVKTPFVSTKTGGIPEYFDASNLIEPKNIFQLTNKIEELLNLPKIPKLKKAINNKEVVEEFSRLYSQ